MTTTHTTRPTSHAETAAEMDRRGAVIEQLEADIEILRSENERLRDALADAIARPMGVVPSSAESLASAFDLALAEGRRIKSGRPRAALKGGEQ